MGTDPVGPEYVLLGVLFVSGLMFYWTLRVFGRGWRPSDIRNPVLRYVVYVLSVPWWLIAMTLGSLGFVITLALPLWIMDKVGRYVRVVWRQEVAIVRLDMRTLKRLERLAPSHLSHDEVATQALNEWLDARSQPPQT